MSALEFPAEFLWGVATSAHQTEGGNTNNDWWDWEHDPSSGCVESSGDACDSWHRWPDDIDLVASLGLDAYRFSLEWSRIEPAEGEFSIAALDHYRRMCETCIARGVRPWVTFHHFTVPRWLAARGAWEAKDASDAFARFVARASAHLEGVIDTACTINEPNVIGVVGYLQGDYPPGARDAYGRQQTVADNLIRGHCLAVAAIKEAAATTRVGLTLSMDEMVADAGGEAIRDAAEEFLENPFLRAAAQGDGDDFIGVQTYTRIHFDATGKAPDDPTVPTTLMGYENWPYALDHTVRRAATVTGLPVIVTESGIATTDDRERITYLTEALRGVHRCIVDRVDVGGFFVWSLLDNFEWNSGYAPTFGLCSVDRTTFDRTPKPSAHWYAKIARSHRLSP